MDLLRREELVKTSAVDHADWNYRGLLGTIQRRRFRLLLSLLGNEHFTSLLEVGYGSGVLMPALCQFADRVYGLDVHRQDAAVGSVLGARGVDATLMSGNVTDIPFPAAHFGCVVSVSTMEYVEDIRTACAEIRRVLRPDGVFALVTPGQSALLDIGLRLRTGESAEENYADRRKRLMPVLLEEFEAEVRKAVRFLGVGPVLYTGLKLKNKPQEAQ